MKTFACLLLLSLPFLISACGEESTDGETNTASLPEHYWLSSVPADAKDVGAARLGLSEGANVTVRGVIGGSTKPFVEGLAAFTLVDPALKSCVGDGMNCKTPWDYCCEDPKKIADNSVTVEFREGGTTLNASLRGTRGLDHLKTVVVQGVAERDDQGNVTIVASGLRAVD